MSSASTDWSPAPVWAAPAPSDAPSPDRGAPRRRRRRTRLALLAVGVAFVALVAAERFGRSYAQGEIADRLREGGVTGEVDVSVGSSWWRPSVLPALVTGDLDQVTVRVRDGSLMGVPVDRADYVLSGIDGDVSLLDGTVAVHSIDRGSVVIRIPPSALSQAVGAEVTIRDGRLAMGDPPRPVPARMEQDMLVLGDGSDGAQAVSVPVVDPYVLPCRPELHVGPTSLELSCAGRRLPGILRTPLQGDGSDVGPGSTPGGELAPPQSTVRPGG